jgi:plastocyanin
LKLSAIAAVFGAVLGLGSVVPAASHRVLLQGADAKYEMEPDDLEASPGDSVIFQVNGGAPHALGIDPTGMSAAAHEAWNRALPRRVGDLRGPLIRQNDRYVIVVPRGIAKGKYRVFCSPHRAYDEDLDLEIK